MKALYIHCGRKNCSTCNALMMRSDEGPFARFIHEHELLLVALLWAGVGAAFWSTWISMFKILWRVLLTSAVKM